MTCSKVRLNTFFNCGYRCDHGCDYFGTHVPTLCCESPKTIAMLKSLGASKQWIVKWLSVQVSLLVVIGAVLGITIGIGLEFLLRIPLGDLLPTPLPSYGIEPAILAILSSILIGVPALGIPLIGLVNTSAISVIQSSHQSNESYKKYLLLLVPIIPMMLMYGDNLLVWIVLAGIACLFLVLAIVSTLVLRLVGKLPTSTSMRLALSRINRTPLATGIQFGSLALSLMLLSIIWLVRSDLLSDWQQTLQRTHRMRLPLTLQVMRKTVISRRLMQTK